MTCEECDKENEEEEEYVQICQCCEGKGKESRKDVSEEQEKMNLGAEFCC